jgi:transcriptional regulator with XRE-family HTH domain
MSTDAAPTAERGRLRWKESTRREGTSNGHRTIGSSRIACARPPTEPASGATTNPPDHDDLASAVGAAIRDARVRAGLSLNEVARLSDGRYSPSSLGGYERGERAISVIRFCDLARLLGTPPDQLLGRALGIASSDGRREVVLELADLPDSEPGRQAAAFAHRMKSSRGDYLSTIVTLRAGDLQVIADASGLDVPHLLSSLGPAVKRVGPGERARSDPRAERRSAAADDG